MTRIINRRDRTQHPPAHAPGYKTSVLRSPRAPLISLEPSAVELTTPALPVDQFDELENDLIRNGAVEGEALGERIIVHGRVIDEMGRPVPNALLEVWQANAAGRYRHVTDGYLAPIDPNFTGVGRCVTDADGAYAYRTVRPGPYPWLNHGSQWRPAHIHYSIFGHAFAQRLVTQMYFEGDPLIPLCPIANSVPDEAALDRLIARLDMGEMKPFDALAYRFDVVLRGSRQTFFENQPEGL